MAAAGSQPFRRHCTCSASRCSCHTRLVWKTGTCCNFCSSLNRQGRPALQGFDNRRHLLRLWLSCKSGSYPVDPEGALCTLTWHLLLFPPSQAWRNVPLLHAVVPTLAARLLSTKAIHRLQITHPRSLPKAGIPRGAARWASRGAVPTSVPTSRSVCRHRPPPIERHAAPFGSHVHSPLSEMAAALAPALACSGQYPEGTP